MASDFDPTMLWLSGSFIVFAFLVYRMGKGAFLKALDSRIAEIREEIETAENLRIEAQEFLAQYQRKHRDSLEDAKKIITDAEARAEEITKQADKDLKEIFVRREKQLQDRLYMIEQTAIAEIQKRTADLAIRATSELIAKEMDKKTKEKLVEKAIKDISGNLH